MHVANGLVTIETSSSTQRPLCKDLAKSHKPPLSIGVTDKPAHQGCTEQVTRPEVLASKLRYSFIAATAAVIMNKNMQELEDFLVTSRLTTVEML